MSLSVAMPNRSFRCFFLSSSFIVPNRSFRRRSFSSSLRFTEIPNLCETTLREMVISGPPRDHYVHNLEEPLLFLFSSQSQKDRSLQRKR
mmetsp:Transcript_14690/g.20492  ORF Transcript_14690/g.20492 Transcript_14690/m.20492 type:complete len:90 (-) Transcript_14690:197-466(-)